MKSYESPIIYDNDELAEGIYATGSGGAGDCWTIDYTVPQAWNGTAKVFELKCKHSKSVYHNSHGTVITLVFDQPIVSAYPENSNDYKVEISGSTVKLERNLYADAFFSGDDVTFKLFVNTGSKESTEIVNILSKSIQCKHD